MPSDEQHGEGSRPGAHPSALDAAAVRAWARGALDALAARRADLDALNVFPVADSDTGTNLYLTLADAQHAVAALDEGAGTSALVRAFARGAVTGARGNSGVIVSQYLGVLARDLAQRPWEPDGLEQALGAASRAASLAVAHPVEGTVLTVARAVHETARAAAAAAAGRGARVGAASVLEEALDGGARALRRTTSQLPALRAAGVWDAGAWGLLLVLGALAEALGGAPRPPLVLVPPPDGAVAGDPPEASTAGTAAPCPAGHGDGHPEGGGEFEVMYLVTAPAGAGRPGPVEGADDGGPDVAEGLRSGLAAAGESVAVTGTDGLWHAHVHTDDPWAALAVPRAMGVHRHQVSVRHLASQAGVHGMRRPTLGLVAVTTAAGLVADLARAGAVVVLAPDEPPDVAALDRAVDDTGAPRVLVVSVPELGSVLHHGGSGSVDVEVLGCRTEVQLVAAAATFAARDAQLGAEPLLTEVTAAARGVRGRRVECRGVGAGEQAAHMHQAASELLDPGSTLLTLVTGERTPPGAVDGLRALLAESHPEVEVVALAGGTATDTVELGAE